jgi:signal transduction histidine kinase
VLEQLSPGDRRLVWQLIAIAALSLVLLIAGSRYAENVVLESEAGEKSARTVRFLQENLSDLRAILSGGSPTAGDRVALEFALQAGEAFRYRLYGADGRVVLASRPEDIGERNAAPYFESIVLQGRRFFRVDRRAKEGSYSDAQEVPYAVGAMVVGERYEPIMEGSDQLGVVEVHLDMTALQSRLRRTSLLFLGGLLAMLGLIACVFAVFMYRNLKERRRSIERLDESRQRAEGLARQVSTMLENLLAAEEDKMSRVVGLVDGISHQIGNPLATLSMNLDALEARSCEARDDSCEAQIAAMRDALRRVGAFVHGLTALSVEEGRADAGVDVNEVIRSLAGLVQLSEHTRKAEFALDLSADVVSLSLPRRPVSLSLFIILTAAAENILELPGRIEVRISSSSAVSAGHTASAPGSLEKDHPALDTARRMIESLGGRMTLMSAPPRAALCHVLLPRAGRRRAGDQDRRSEPDPLSG